MRRLVLFAVLCLGTGVAAQNSHHLDSLQHAIDTARLDTFKVRNCMALFNAVVQSGNLPRAQCIADSQLVWSARLDYKKGKRLAYTNYGTLYYHKGDLKKALQYYQASYNIACEMQSPMGMEMGLNNTGVIYKNLGQYDKALHAYNQALVIEQQHGFKEDEANTLGNISSIHIELKNFEKAIHLLQRSQQLKLELNNQVGYTIGVLSEAECAKGLGDTLQALALYKKADSLSTAVDFKQARCDALNGYGTLLHYKRQYDSAVFYFSKSLALARTIGAANAEMVALTSMGKVHTSLKHYGRAEQELTAAYALARSEEDIDGQVAVVSNLANLYENWQQYQKAAKYLDEYIVLHDSILSRDKQEAVARLQTQFETTEKEHQITSLKAAQRAQQADLQASRFKLALLVGAVVFVAVAATLLLVYLRNRNKTKALQQTLHLRNVIASDLHDDIGSSLSSIALFSDVALRQVKPTLPACATLMETISQTAHTTMLNMNDIVWSVNPVNDSFENILARMQQFAAGVLEAQQIALHFNADDALFLKKFPVHYRRDFYLLFKEGVNNLSKYSKAANACVTVQLEAKTLLLTIKDDGVGFDMSRTAGNGLRTMHKRAEAMGGTLTIATGSQGTTVAVAVPLP